MAEYNRGIKAGFWAGLIFGIINAIVTIVIFLSLTESTSGIGTTVQTYVIAGTFTSGIFSGIIYLEYHIQNSSLNLRCNHF